MGWLCGGAKKKSGRKQLATEGLKYVVDRGWKMVNFVWRSGMMGSHGREV